MKQERQKRNLRIIIVCAVFCVSYVVYTQFKPIGFLSTGTVYAQDKIGATKTENTSESISESDLAQSAKFDYSHRVSDLLIDELREREDKLNADIEKFNQEKENLRLLKADVQRKIDELTALKDELDEVVKKVDKKHLAELEILKASLEAMKQTTAQKEIFEGLEIDDAVSILLMMAAKKSGPILDIISPERSIEIIELIKKKKRMP